MEKINEEKNPFEDTTILTLYIEKIFDLLNKHIIDYKSE
jgi:hypothetical protein